MREILWHPNIVHVLKKIATPCCVIDAQEEVESVVRACDAGLCRLIPANRVSGATIVSAWGSCAVELTPEGVSAADFGLLV